MGSPRSLIIAPAAQLTGALISLIRAPIAVLLRPGRNRRRVCVVCDQPVLERDAFLRYRGEYFHAATCLEQEPPALRRRQLELARAGGVT